MDVGNSDCMVRRPVASEKWRWAVWSAQMYPVLCWAVAQDLDGMRCALVL